MKKIYLLISVLTLISSFAYADMQSAIDALNAKNYKKAFKEFQIEAQKGNSEAQDYLGNLYAKGLGVELDYKQAVYWYNKAAKQGNGFAINNLALMYSNANGVSQNDKKAISLFEEASNKGIAIAKYNLGMMYYSGQGVNKNDKKAISLFEEASNDKLPQAQAILGTIYYCGSLGVKQNYNKAFALVKSSAELGFPGGQMSLGTLYKEGKAVKQDYLKSYMWYYISYKNGNRQAVEGIDLVKDKMTKQQIAEARKLGDEWMKNHKEIDVKLLAAGHLNAKLPTNTR